MSCKHGEWHEEDCEHCNAEDAAYERGRMAAMAALSNTSKDDAEQFKIASRLLVQWLADRPNPHMAAIVTGSGAELLAGYCTANQRLP